MLASPLMPARYRCCYSFMASHIFVAGDFWVTGRRMRGLLGEGAALSEGTIA